MSMNEVWRERLRVDVFYVSTEAVFLLTCSLERGQAVCGTRKYAVFIRRDLMNESP